jgi:hypothetical protein
LGVRYDPKTGGLKEHRFNLGKDAKLAEHAMSRLTQLWGHIVATFIYTGSIGPFKPHWNEFTLWLADQIIGGNTTVTIPRRGEKNTAEYAASFNRIQQAFPFILFVPDEAEAYLEGVGINKKTVENRLVQNQEFEISRGRLASKIVVQPVRGTLHQALDAYDAHVDRTGERLEGGELKPSQQLRKERIKRFKINHVEIQLALLNLEQCSEMVSYWRNRPSTKRGKRCSRDNARHHVSELFRFFRWLDTTEQFDWQMPRGLTAIPRRIAKFEHDRSLSSVTKKVYSVEQLATINQHATPLERLSLYVGLNCAMGAAELGRLLLHDIVLHEEHPFTDRLRFESTVDDGFIRYFRPKTDVFGEWLLWQPVADFLPWAIERAKRIGSNVLLVSADGNPLYAEHSKNAQAGFQNQWNNLIDRVKKSEPSFPHLPFGTLRDTLPDMLRQTYTGGDELASLCVCHGTPCKTDNLLDCYANKPFGRLHTAIREVFEHFAPIFDIDDPTDNRKHYLPVKTHETVKAMRRAGDSVAEISQRMGVHPSTVYRMTATQSERADTTSK